MIVSATDLAKRSKAIVDSVIETGAAVYVHRHQRLVAEIRKCAGVTREELIRRLAGVKFSAKEEAELKKAMAEAVDVFGYAGGN
jgi:hypothetical protein